jgi:hypothetical protein
MIQGYYKFGISPCVGNFASATYYGISILFPLRHHIKLKVIRSINVLISTMNNLLSPKGLRLPPTRIDFTDTVQARLSGKHDLCMPEQGNSLLPCLINLLIAK